MGFAARPDRPCSRRSSALRSALILTRRHQTLLAVEQQPTLRIELGDQCRFDDRESPLPIHGDPSRLREGRGDATAWARLGFFFLLLLSCSSLCPCWAIQTASYLDPYALGSFPTLPAVSHVSTIKYFVKYISSSSGITLFD